MIRFLPSFRSLSLMVAPAIAVLTLANAPTVHAQQFTTGNIVVLQVGDGLAPLTSAGTAVFLKEFTSSGTSGVSIAVPTTGAHRLVVSGSATSEGLMTLSADSLRLAIPGYDTTTGYASIASSLSATVARVIDTVSYLGIAGHVDTTKVAFSANNIRGAARATGENYYATGNGGGIYYMGNTAAPSFIATASTNNRGIIAANGNLYFSTGSGTTPGIYKISGQPNTGTAIPVSIITATGSSPYGFAVNAAESVIYVADDRTTTTLNSGGIQKWTLSGGVWSLAYTLVPPTGTTGSRSVIADWSGPSPVLYGITTDNRLVKYTDPGTLAGVISSVLATAPTNTVYRSVAFTPKMPPACTTPVLALTTSAKKCTANGAITLTVTSGSTPVSYSWTGPGAFTATTQNLTNLSAPGSYTVTALATGGCSATATAIVLDSAIITATLTAGGTTAICQGDSVMLSANTGTGYTYQFNNGGSPIAGATGISYKAGAAGNYTVTVSSGINCTATSSPALSVTVNALPAATVTPAGPLTVCAGVPVVLHTNKNAGLTYQWKLNGTNISGGTDSTYTVNGFTGSFSVTVRNTATTCSATSIPVVINNFPHADTTVTPAGAQSFCSGDSLKLKAVSAAGATYQWRDAVGQLSGATDSVYTVRSAGAYRVVITTANGCKDTSATHVITVNNRPLATFTASADTACQKSLITLTGATGTGYSYQWFYGGILFPNTTSTINVSGVVVGGPAQYFRDSARVVITNASGCRDTSAYRVLTFRPLPQPVITNIAGVLATAATYQAYQWYKDGLPINGATAATFTPAANGSYNVMVADAFSCADTSATPLNVSGLGIRAIGQHAVVKVYPNPASDVLYIEAVMPVTIQVRDMQGRVVLTEKAAKRVDIAALANGVYMLSATDASGALLQTERVVKTKQ